MPALPFALLAAVLAASAVPATKRQIGQQSGQATYYDAGLGVCGVTNSDSDAVAAVSSALFDTFPGYDGTNPVTNPICGRWAIASYNGRSVRVQIEDSCPTCRGFGDLDLSTSAFIALVGSLDAGRAEGVTWELD